MKKRHMCIPPPPHPDLTNPCPLCVEISRLLRSLMREMTESRGMTDSYRPFVRLLYEQDDVTQLELVRLTRLTAPTVSVTLQKMELDGLVTRRQDSEDLRSVRVLLTEKGRKLHEEVHRSIEEVEALALDGIDTDQQELLKQLLLKMRDNLTKERSEKKADEAD